MVELIKKVHAWTDEKGHLLKLLNDDAQLGQSENGQV